MIWSLFKIVIFVGLVAAATFAAAYVIDIGGEVRVSLGAMEFSLTPLAGMISLVVILMIGWIVFRVAGLLVATLRFFNGDETALSRYFDRNRERKGFEALADGLMALASGEGRVAMAKAARAEKFLSRPELTLLLSAQAAEQSGETKRAQDYYKKLLADDRTRFVGVQGILKQKLKEGDTETALKLAEKAFALRPRHETTQDLLFSLQSQKSDWSGARETLAAKLKARALPKDVHQRRDAVLALADAREKIDAGDIEAGAKAAFEANRLSPDLVPAAILAAEMHTVKDAPKSAVKVLKKAWTAAPHPDLAAAFADLEPNEDASSRRKRFAPLLKLHADHPETRLLVAELAIVDEDFSAARRAIGELSETNPDVRVLTMMAAVERGEGAADQVVRGWLTKALNASRGAQWICSNCKHLHTTWVPICENCTSFDTLTWELPPQQTNGAGASVTMLPLIVGALEEFAGEKHELSEDVVETGSASGSSDLEEMAEASSDDMDGILGDPHTVPTESLQKSN